MNSFFSLLALTSIAALACGCASSGHRQAVKTVASLADAADGIQDTLPPFDAALFALSGLVNETGTDMAPQFKAYSAAVRQLQAQAQVAGLPAVDMQRQGLDYFETWNKARAGIQDGETRMRSLDRTLEVGAQFEHARDSYARSQVDFAPFMADLRDIRVALAADLSPGGLDSIRDLAGRVGANGEPLRASLQNLSVEFRNLGVALSSSAPAT